MNLTPPNDKQPIYSVSQLNRAAKLLLNDHFLNLKVEGEISNLSRPSSGHIYFSLKDSTAQVRCAMFRMHQRKLNFSPENGQQVIVSAQVSLYEPRGDYQLIVDNMEEAGDGALRQAFEALKQKLSDQGLFDVDIKKNIPILPKSIGVITSPSGAAIRDILTVLRRRFPAIPVIIYPVSVQGEQAKFEITQALQTADQRQECDVILLARGGGSLEDLWAFNEEIVAHAIADCSIPVISGIGHEIDFTIADFVADLRAPTPSAAAEHASPDQQEWLGQFQAYENYLIQQFRKKQADAKQKLDWLIKRLQQQHPGQKLERNAQRLDELELRLQQSIRRNLAVQQGRLDTQSAKLWSYNPVNKIKRHQQQQQHLNQRLNAAIVNKLDKLKQQLALSSQTLHAVSPLATLNRGYAIASKPESNEVLHSSRQLIIGDKVKTRLAQGSFISTIEEINHD